MNTRAKKSLGQNFLNAPSVIKKMIDVCNLEEGDLVVEVGPGKGALTKVLLERNLRVVAYELDPRMIDYLNEHYASYVASGQLQLLQQDILGLDISEVFSEHSYTVVANIPYYITNAIIRLFLSAQHQPRAMSLLVQKEVAERIARDEAESILSMSVKVYGEPRYVTKVARRYFTPSPKVDSAVIAIFNISRDRFDSKKHEEVFFHLVKLGFAHKRKQLASNLASDGFDKKYWQEQLSLLGYPPTVRAQELSVEDFLLLSSG